MPSGMIPQNSAANSPHPSPAKPLAACQPTSSSRTMTRFAGAKTSVSNRATFSLGVASVKDGGAGGVKALIGALAPGDGGVAGAAR